jgi:hypothetical protein
LTANQHGHKTAINKAASLLREQDLSSVCKKCGASIKGNSLLLKYFQRQVQIIMPEIEFEPPDLPEEERLLLLHYLTGAGSQQAGSPLKTQSKHVGFQQLPGGMFYFSAYKRNGPERILRVFGREPEKIIDAAGVLGGTREEYHDVSVKIPVFPRIDVIVIIHKGDEEFPPEVNLLFSENINNFLPLEDVSILGGIIAGYLKKSYYTGIK